MPLAGGTLASVCAVALLSVVPLMVGFCFSGAAVPAGGAAALGVDGLAGIAGPTETRGVIFLRVDLFTPAFERSSTDWYGRPAMIFFAVASPTPGSFSRSSWLAELMSTFAAGVALLLA